MSKRKTRGKRKFVVWSLAIILLIVVIAIYETNKEIKRQESAPGVAGGQAGTVGGDDMPVEKAQAILRSYYRSHDLPTGWDVGETEISAPERLEVTIFFAPRIGDSRHGKPAALGDINANIACPLDGDVARQVARFSVWIMVEDKTGLIDSFVCS